MSVMTIESKVEEIVSSIKDFEWGDVSDAINLKNSR